MVVWAADERVRLARSQAVRRRRRARGLDDRSANGMSVRVRGADESKLRTLLVLPLELLDEVVDEAVVEGLPTKVSITSGGLDLEDTLLNRQERDVECSSTEIEDEDVALAGGLLVKTIRDSGRSGLVDDTKNVEVNNRTCVFGSSSTRGR